MASPAAVGADESRITRALELASAAERLTSLLIVKDGYLVLDEYFRGSGVDSLVDVRSVTKSIVSALTGIALENGFLPSLDALIGDYLHPDVVVLESEMQNISVGHLLTMTGGFAWNESGTTTYAEWITSGRHIEHLIDKGLDTTPGSTFVYNSAAVHLLGVVLERAVGMPLPAFADEYLFDMIGVRERVWEQLTNGYVNGGAGIDLKPRDLARFGQLFLQGGRSGSVTVLSQGWITASIQPRFTWRFTFGPVNDISYGYLWWIVTGELEPAYFAWGFGGQFIYVVPDLELVVVATTEWRGVNAEGGPDRFEIAALEVIVDELVPAFR